MTTLSLVLVSMLVGSGGDCGSEELKGAAWHTSASLQELAGERSVSEQEVGGLLVLWDLHECERSVESDVSGENTEASPEACAKFVELVRDPDQEFVDMAREPVSESRRTVASVAWAEVRPGKGSVHHVIVASPDEAIELVHPGYGREGAVAFRCIDNPWFKD